MRSQPRVDEKTRVKHQFKISLSTLSNCGPPLVRRHETRGKREASHSPSRHSQCFVSIFLCQTGPFINELYLAALCSRRMPRLKYQPECRHPYMERGDVVYNELNFKFTISQRLRFQKLPFQLYLFLRQSRVKVFADTILSSSY